MKNVPHAIELLDQADKELAPDKSAARLREIDGLLKSQLTELGFSTYLLARKRIWERRFPETRRGGDRRSAEFFKTKNISVSFGAAAAQELDLSERAIQLAVKLAEDLGRDDIARLWDSPIKDNAANLRVFAALEAGQRDKLYRAMQAKPDEAFGDWLERAGLRSERGSSDAAFDKLNDTWWAAPASVRRRFLIQIGVPERLVGDLVRRRKSEAA